MPEPPSNRMLALSVLATLGCLAVIYLSIVWGSRTGAPRAPIDAGPAQSAALADRHAD